MVARSASTHIAPRGGETEAPSAGVEPALFRLGRGCRIRWATTAYTEALVPPQLTRP